MRNQHDAGFSLIETILATALTLVVVSAGLGAFVKAMDITDTSRIISETNQSLQVAESLMVRDFIQVGQGIPRGGIPIPAGNGSNPIPRPREMPGLFFPVGWS